jgi:hypothetical protein
MPSLASYAAKPKLELADVKKLLGAKNHDKSWVLHEDYVAPASPEHSKQHTNLARGKEILFTDELNEAPLSKRERELLTETIKNQTLFLPCSPLTLTLWAELVADVSLLPSFLDAVFTKHPQLLTEAVDVLTQRYVDSNKPSKYTPPPSNARRPYKTKKWTTERARVQELVYSLYSEVAKIPSSAYVLEHIVAETGKHGAIFYEYDPSENRLYSSDLSSVAIGTVEKWIAKERSSLR